MSIFFGFTFQISCGKPKTLQTIAKFTMPGLYHCLYCFAISFHQIRLRNANLEEKKHGNTLISIDGYVRVVIFPVYLKIKLLGEEWHGVQIIGEPSCLSQLGNTWLAPYPHWSCSVIGGNPLETTDVTPPMLMNFVNVPNYSGLSWNKYKSPTKDTAHTIPIFPNTGDHGK